MDAEIFWFDTLESTHLWTIDSVKNNFFTKDGLKIITSNIQTNGIGSRGNKWIGNRGNLHLSWCLNELTLPKDLPLSSISIYYAWIFLKIFRDKKSDCWLKWPNDIYVEDKKIGGIICTKVKNFIIGSIGVNLKNSPDDFGVIDIDISTSEVIEAFKIELDNNFTWKHIFRNYSLEFHKSRMFNVHIQGQSLSLKDAILCDDGAIKIDGKKVYSLR